jgi:hypothetical protein
MYLTSNIPYFKCWVRKEFTHAHSTSITGNTYTAWQLLSRQYLTDASAFRSSSRVVRLKESLTLMAGLCGQGCRSLHLWGTFHWKSGLSVCRPIWLSLGTVVRTTTELLRSPGPSLRLGCARLITSFILEDICLRWTTPRVMSPKTPPSINRAMFSS